MEHPNFKLYKWADFGTEEVWSARVSLGLSELLNALRVTEEEKNRTGAAFIEMINELGSSFTALRKVSVLEGTNNVSLIELHKEYTAVYHHVWAAYRDRLVTLAETVGYDIDFAFKAEKDFESGSRQFLATHAGMETLVALLTQNRPWQFRLADLRNNVIQHKKEDQAAGLYFTVAASQAVFDCVWQTIEEIVLLLVAPRIPFPYQIYEIAEEERDPVCAKRFEISVRQEILEALIQAHT